MARLTFGGDDVVLNTSGIAAAGQFGFAWSAETGGTAVTDLQDMAGVALPLGKLTSGAGGKIPPFKGPDARVSLWLDFGGPRFYTSAHIEDVVLAASSTVVGLVRFATTAEVASGSSAQAAVRPADVAAAANAVASATTAGVVRLATTVEAAAGTDFTIAVTPVSLAVKQDAFREYSTLAAATAGLAAGDFADGAYVVVTG